MIVDDFSRYVWAKFLSKKSQATNTLIELIKQLENQLELDEFRYLGEVSQFISDQIKHFCSTRGSHVSLLLSL